MTIPPSAPIEAEAARSGARSLAAHVLFALAGVYLLYSGGRILLGDPAVRALASHADAPVLLTAAAGSARVVCGAALLMRRTRRAAAIVVGAMMLVVIVHALVSAARGRPVDAVGQLILPIVVVLALILATRFYPTRSRSR